MKRHVFRILLCLVLGVVTTVGVAWGFAVRGSNPPISPSRSEYGVFAEHFWADDRSWETWLSVGLGRVQAGQSTGLPGIRLSAPLARVRLPPWSRLRQGDPIVVHCRRTQDDSGLVSYRELASGWPSLALRFSCISRLGANWSQPQARRIYLDSEGLLALPMPSRSESVGRELPLLPIWPGFLIDTLFYGAVWFALLFGFSTTRRIVRHRRGRCPACGHDLRGAEHAICPECGRSA